MDQWVKMHATKPDNLSLIPLPLVEGESQLSQAVLCLASMHALSKK